MAEEVKAQRGGLDVPRTAMDYDMHLWHYHKHTTWIVSSGAAT